MRKENRSSLDILRSIPISDLEYILHGYLPYENADPVAYLKIYDLLITDKLTVPQIAKKFNVTPTTIKNKVERMIELIQRDPIIIGKLPPDTDILAIPVERLIISERSYRCLKRANLNAVGDIVRSSEDDLIRIKNLGRISLNEIKAVLYTLISNYSTESPLSKLLGKLRKESLSMAGQSGSWTIEDHRQLDEALAIVEKDMKGMQSAVDLILKSAVLSTVSGRQGYLVPIPIWAKLSQLASVSGKKGLLDIKKSSAEGF